MRRIGAIGTAAALALTIAAASDAACIGDCDASGSVIVNELVTGVAVALGSQPARVCILIDVNGDGKVTIDELITAVASALNGCPSGAATATTVATTYADIVLASYTESITAATQMRDAVHAFVDGPTAPALERARTTWLQARPSYLRTEMTRFYDGPIDNEETGVESLVNAWPLDEAYIDYVAGNLGAGIINDPDEFPDIDAAVLIEANEAEGETTISTGWHAIEFLLWGQDVSATGPGNRPFTDYVTDGTGTSANQARRAAYLRSVTDLLISDLEQVRDAWVEQPGNYRAEFLAANGNEQLRRILTGLGTLSGGELTGERLATAYRTKDQEDEHSCFSDNTHVDFREDERGIRNVFFGNGGAAHGFGIYDLVRTVDPTLADRARDAVQAAGEAIYAIPAPFDRAILGSDEDLGRRAIKAAIDALNVQTEAIADCAAALGVSISTTF
jgi:putative iron-regulated protein